MASGDVVGHVLNSMPPAANFAPPDILAGASTPAENIPNWKFDASADEHSDFYCFLEGYGGGGLTITLYWSAGSSTGGHQVRWDAAIRRVADDAEDLDTTAHTYDFNGVSADVPSAVGELGYDTIAFTSGTDMDDLVEGEYFIFRIRRDADHADDDSTGDSRLYGFKILET